MVPSSVQYPSLVAVVDVAVTRHLVDIMLLGVVTVLLHHIKQAIEVTDSIKMGMVFGVVHEVLEPPGLTIEDTTKKAMIGLEVIGLEASTYLHVEPVQIRAGNHVDDGLMDTQAAVMPLILCNPPPEEHGIKHIVHTPVYQVIQWLSLLIKQLQRAPTDCVGPGAYYYPLIILEREMLGFLGDIQ